MRPCDFRLSCGHMCPFKVIFITVPVSVRDDHFRFAVSQR